ncbi:MAG TPA: ATP-dependent helicase [Firmicutes bacterium]|nr:ATP-dependent helicase [Bacillota bacterium]HBG43953.1 ATP-dependent helicase [Bacillota bacterium]
MVLDEKQLIQVESAVVLPAEVILPDDTDYEFILKGQKQKAFDTWKAFQLSYKAEQIAARPGFESLLCLEHLRERWRKAGVVTYPHQLKVLRRVVGKMRGRAILADEVGLGKTIEAAMVLIEYYLRGLAKKVLILTPASLCRQWQMELQDKFGLRFVTARRPEDWEHYDLVVASIDAAKRPENAEVILHLNYDMLIVDEAHKLKNVNTRNYQLVSGIHKKYFLLLTATPLQNNLKELYNLITLLRPGQLGSYRSFRKQFVADNRTPRNVDNLKQLLGEVVIRNRRANTQVAFTKRIVEQVCVELSETERLLYRTVEQFIRNDLFRTGNTLALITLQREICSSSFAAALTLVKMLAPNAATALATAPVPATAPTPAPTPASEQRAQELYQAIELAGNIQENSKMKVLEEIVSRDNEKVIIFTEFLATQQYIMARLANLGMKSLPFDGSSSANRKEWLKGLFREHPNVKALVCTETGGEGINLQFCRTLINYDLPWNPMRIEQRIGRVHRLGQTRDVRIFNLYTKNTVEEHIVRLLAEKINLFQTVVGDLDLILDVFSRNSLEQHILATMRSASSEQSEFRRSIDAFGDKLRQELESEAEKRSLDRLLFSDSR